MSSVQLIDDNELTKLNARPSVRQYAGQLWDRRFFIYAEAESKAFSPGRDMFLGKLWIVLDPLFQVLIYGIVFGMILNVSRGMDNFVGFLVIGVIFFGFVSKGITGGVNLVQKSRNLISAFQFPRASIVISSVLRQFLDNIFPALVAISLALAFQAEKPITWSILLIVPLYLLIHLFILGITFWVARITAFVPDFKPLFSLLSRALFFVSGVFFSIDRFDPNPLLQKLVEINPIYQFLMAIRACVLNGQSPSSDVWGYLVAWTLILAVSGFFFFWQAEERYAQVR